MLPLLVVLAIVLFIVVDRPHYFVYATMILAFAVFPAGVPFFLYVGGVQFYLYEPFLMLAFIWSILRVSNATRLAFVVGGLNLAVGGAWSLWGLLSEFTFSFINTDVRPLVDLALTIPVAATILAAGKGTEAWRVLVGILWFSAGMTLLSSLTGFALAGREEAATLNFGGASSADAIRFLTTSTDLASVVLAGLIASVVVYPARRGHLLALVPAFLIVFLAFSRNTLLGIAASLAVAVAWAVASGRLQSTVRKLIAAGIVTAGLGGVLFFAPSLVNASGWLGAQFGAVSSRVFGGISASALESDPSSLYRSLEVRYLVPAFAGSPLLGHGFGFAYKPPLGSGLNFFTVQGRFYAHQYYLWLLVKVGLLGFVAVLGSWGAAAVNAWRAGGLVALGLVSGLAASLTVSVVAPMPNGEPGAVVVGGLVGALAGLSRASISVDFSLTEYGRTI